MVLEVQYWFWYWYWYYSRLTSYHWYCPGSVKLSKVKVGSGNIESGDDEKPGCISSQVVSLPTWSLSLSPSIFALSLSPSSV